MDKGIQCLDVNFYQSNVQSIYNRPSGVCMYVHHKILRIGPKGLCGARRAPVPAEVYSLFFLSLASKTGYLTVKVPWHERLHCYSWQERCRAIAPSYCPLFLFLAFYPSSFFLLCSSSLSTLLLFLSLKCIHLSLDPPCIQECDSSADCRILRYSRFPLQGKFGNQTCSLLQDLVRTGFLKFTRHQDNLGF